MSFVCSPSGAGLRSTNASGLNVRTKSLAWIVTGAFGAGVAAGSEAASLSSDSTDAAAFSSAAMRARCSATLSSIHDSSRESR